MALHQDEIIRRYRPLAQLPDALFAFTFPIRALAVRRLRLKPGGRVVVVSPRLAERLPGLRVEDLGPGVLFLAEGLKE